MPCSPSPRSRWPAAAPATAATTGPTTPPTAVVEKAPAGAVEVHFAYSPEKEPLLKEQIKAFNGSGAQVGGKPVFVRAEIVSSGDAEARIADGSFKPVAWSPPRACGGGC